MFLDDRPVNANDRRLAEAWVRGGREEEDIEKMKLIEEKKKKNLKSVEEG